MRLSTVLDQVELRQITLPEFQRGYVWNREQVRGLFQSLYRRYPVGSLLVWTTEADPEVLRTDQDERPTGVTTLLLDGQQRITTLYGVIKGRPPEFFQGNAKAFTDLYFNVETEEFQFYGPLKMSGDPTWISVTAMFQPDYEHLTEQLQEAVGDLRTAMGYGRRIDRVRGIRDIELHQEQITGAERTIDEVVDIFNRVNSGGTKLSAGDLALARICADRPSARSELRRLLGGWERAGYSFSMEWLLRCVNSVVTGQAVYTAMRHVSSEDFHVGLKKTEQSINFLLNLVADRLGLDHDRVLAGRYSFTALVRHVAQRGGTITDHQEQQRILFWYVHSFLWGRYSGSTETVLRKDLDALEAGGIEGLIAALQRERGSLDVRPEDFETQNVSSRFYPMLYLLTRVGGGRDLGSGITLNAAMLGANSSLQLHHIFPKRRLYDAAYASGQVNAVANMCFLTASSNLSISDSDPAVYLGELESRNPGVLASQWITTAPALWLIADYEAFLADRRSKLANAANMFLRSLVAGAQEFAGEVGSDAPSDAAGDASASDPERTRQLDEILHLVARLGLSAPSVDHEVTNEESGEMLAMADLAWPDGAQEGLTQPVALLLEPHEEMERRLGELGYRFFTSKERLVRYLEQLVGADLDGDGVVGDPDQAV